ncbi:MAG: Hsp20/alpha crystallin family protein [Terriglobales bacterium]
MTTTLLLQGHSATCTPADWAPRANVIENEQGYQLELDLPGVKRDELDIQVDHKTITIKGDRKLTAEAEAYHRVEHPYGSFSRVFLLPDFVNPAGIQAKLGDGVLLLTLPRREEAKPKQIQVQVQ